MEVLTTGEKIKRARIYKGLTLKDLCGDKLSVSKLSCIENDKIKAEPETLRFISEKLGIGFDYLTESTKTQIENNIKIFSNRKNIKDYEEVLEYNLNYALENNYYDISFQLMHMLVSHYLEEEKCQVVQMLTSKYYDIYNKSSEDINYLTYHSDMGKYFFLNKEYNQAVNYFNSIRNYLEHKNSDDTEEMAKVIYNEMNCYIMAGRYDAVFKLTDKLKNLVSVVTDKIEKGKMYHILAVLALKIGEDSFEDYEKSAYECYEGDVKSKCNAIFDFARCMFEARNPVGAVEYIKLGLDIYPDEGKDSKVRYMINCIGELIENGIFDIAEEVCDEASNIAIMLDNVRYIERTYYYRALILQKQGNYSSAEMYMNLSMDALFKYGNKYERYERYLEMGNMYHKLGQVNDAIKYLSLAMFLEKKL
ncbi:MAG: helix-turn-helix transcriptional regulator [Bacillota bacterium]|nr:helix-turn-helix transcriptional regulator [Bacillota bacterium]